MYSRCLITKRNFYSACKSDRHTPLAFPSKFAALSLFVLYVHVTSSARLYMVKVERCFFLVLLSGCELCLW